MLMSSGIRFGLARTWPHLLGVTLGFVVMVIGVGAGLAQVFVALPQAQSVLKLVSVAYLLVLAWKIATAEPRHLRTFNRVAAALLVASLYPVVFG